MGMSIQNQEYMSTMGAITATGTTTLFTPTGSNCVYLCYGFINVRGATGTKKINICSGSSTTVIWSVDTTAGGLGNHRIDFGDKGWRITAGAVLYAVVDATHDAVFAFTAYQSY